jgi:type IV secretory pathway VirB10-like protein
MGSSRLAFAAVGLACVAAAAGGSYFATRQNVAERAATTVSASEVPSAPAASSTPPAVQETEGIVGEPARPPAPAGEAPPGAPGAPRSQAAVKKQKPATPARSSRPDTTARAEQQPPATLDRSWPSSSSSPATEPVAAPNNALPGTPTEDPAAEQVARTPEPADPAFEEVTVAADSVIGLQTETTLSSERARVEDRVEARVVRDVRVGGRVAIPAGTRALGSVVVVERGGKLRDRARLGIRFHTLALADGTRLPVTTETIYRYGDAPGNGSAAKIGGGAVAGAILGAIIGGGKGAAIGATTGAAGGGAAVMAGDRSEAVFPAGAPVTARILSPVTITLDR